MRGFGSMALDRAIWCYLLVLLQSTVAPALTITETDPASIKSAAKQIATEMMG